MTEKTSFRDMALRAVAVVGLVAVLLVGAWGIIQIAFYLPTLFTNPDTTEQPITTTPTPGADTTQTPTPAPAGPESLAVVAPNIIASGQAFLLSWNHQNSTGNYAYQISYSCASGLSLKAPVPTGSYAEVVCNTPFNFVGATSSMPIILAVTGGKQVQTSLTVSAQRLSDGATTSLASSTTAVLPPTNSQTKTVTAPSVKPSAVKSTTSSNRAGLSGYSDFAVEILSLEPSRTMLGSTHYTAKFVIQNVGTNVTPANWAFDAIIPLTPPYTYHSPVQRALYPGDKIVYTLGFDVPQNNNQYFAQHQDMFTIIADPQNIAQEVTEQNNTASLPLPVY